MIDFKIPKENPLELILYIWKIIDLPKISKSDLLHQITFKLYLLPPEKTANFINKSIENNLLKINLDNTISLSDKLENKFKSWQKKREEIINRKERDVKTKNIILKDLDKKKNSDYNVLLKIFSDKSTINRAVSISTELIKFLEVNQDKEVVKAQFLGSKKESYSIEIDLKKKTIKHNCHDYVERRAPNKKFCKHLTRLFLIMKEKNKKFVENLLSNLADSINEWEYLS